MGIYSAKFEAAIQGPDMNDIGVDLNAVEKEIAGPEGIEAHKEEIEDAIEGVVDEPLEEVAMGLYESEYNYNQLMQAIGLNEIAEAQMGRDLVLEAVDVKGFFTKVKNIITNLFKTITNAVKTALDTIANYASTDKKLVSQYKDRILAGADGNWTAKGYKFAKDIFVLDVSDAKLVNTYAVALSTDLTSLRKGENVELVDIDDAKSEIASKFAGGVVAGEIKAMQQALDLKLRGSNEPVELKKGDISGEEVINILSNDTEIKDIKKSYNEVKGNYGKTLAAINKMEKAITAADYGDYTKAIGVANHYINIIKFEKNALNSAYAITLRAAKDKRAQARKLAHAFIKAAPAVKSESGNVYGKTSLFEGIVFA